MNEHTRMAGTVTDPIWYPIVMTALIVAIVVTAAVLAHAVERARWDRTGLL